MVVGRAGRSSRRHPAPHASVVGWGGAVESGASLASTTTPPAGTPPIQEGDCAPPPRPLIAVRAGWPTGAGDRRSPLRSGAGRGGTFPGPRPIPHPPSPIPHPPSPIPHPPSPVPSDRDLVDRYGRSATVEQALNPGLVRWRQDDALVAYAPARRAPWGGAVRVVAGRPVCPEGRTAEVAAAFEAEAAAGGAGVCWFGVEWPFLDTLGDARGHLVVGAEPVWDPAGWAAIYDAHSSVRSQVNRARNKGVEAEPWAGRDRPAPARPGRVAGAARAPGARVHDRPARARPPRRPARDRGRPGRRARGLPPDGAGPRPRRPVRRVGDPGGPGAERDGGAPAGPGVPAGRRGGRLVRHARARPALVARPAFPPPPRRR